MIASMFHKIIMMTLFDGVKDELVLGSQTEDFETWVEEKVFHNSRNILQLSYLDDFRPKENYLSITFDFEDAHGGQTGWTTRDLDLDGNIL